MDKELRKIRELEKKRELREQKKLDEKIMVYEYTRKEYLKLFRQCSWEWFVTLTFKHSLSANYAFSLLRKWNKELREIEGLETAYIALLSFKNPTPHIHLLMLARDGDGKTLRDVSPDKWNRKWKWSSKIKHDAQRLKGVPSYLVRNMTSWDREYGLPTFDPEQFRLDIENYALLEEIRRAEERFGVFAPFVVGEYIKNTKKVEKTTS